MNELSISTFISQFLSVGVDSGQDSSLRYRRQKFTLCTSWKSDNNKTHLNVYTNSQAFLEWRDHLVLEAQEGPEVLEGLFHPEGHLVPGRQEKKVIPEGKLDPLVPRRYFCLGHVQYISFNNFP